MRLDSLALAPDGTATYTPLHSYEVANTPGDPLPAYVSAVGASLAPQSGGGVAVLERDETVSGNAVVADAGVLRTVGTDHERAIDLGDVYADGPMLTGEDDIVGLSYGGVTINTATGVVTPGDDYFEVQAMLVGNGFAGFNYLEGTTESRDVTGLPLDVAVDMPYGARLISDSLFAIGGGAAVDAFVGPFAVTAGSAYPAVEGLGGSFSAFDPCAAQEAVAFIKLHKLDAAQVAADLAVPTENLLGLSGIESKWGAGPFATNGRNNFFSLHGGSDAPFANGSVTSAQDGTLSTFPSYLDSARSFAVAARLPRQGTVYSRAVYPRADAAVQLREGSEWESELLSKHCQHDIPHEAANGLSVATTLDSKDGVVAGSTGDM